MSRIALSASSEAVKELLAGGDEFVPPERLLGGLSDAQARTVPPGSPYSIAQVVAHLDYWQRSQIARARGEKLPRPGSLEDTFAPPAAGGWDALVRQVLDGLTRVGSLAAERGAERQPDVENADIAYGLAESALHNAYHLGQIALLRQIQGYWPPPGGDDSW